MQVALVENANTSNITVIGDGNYRLTLPDGSQVSPVYVGWTGANYRICKLNKEVIPTYLDFVSIGSNAGISYTNSDILTISGGTAVGNTAQVTVNAIGSNGIVTSLIISNSGYYTSNPPMDNVPTGGTGSNLHTSLDMAEYPISSTSYTYNSGTNEVTEKNTYQTPVIDNTVSIERQRQDSLDSDASNQNLRDKLKNATPAQIDNWLQNNVTNLAEARVVLGGIVKFLANKYPKGAGML